MKRKKYSKEKKKRLLSSFLVVLLAINVVISSVATVVSADSTDRLKAFINMAAGKQTTDINVNNLSLSERDLQFLGVYISNFFVPFGTELGTNSDVTTMNKEDIKKALQTNLNFSDSIADSLTETLLNLSKNSSNELVLCVSEDYQKSLVPVSEMPLNYYTALTCMLGGLNELVDRYDDKSTVLEDIDKGKYQYGYFAYQKDGKYVPAFDFDIDMSTITPSTAAFIKALESVDIESGYGFNFFDFTKKEMGTTEGDYKDKVDAFSSNDTYKMSIYGTKLRVDCFGNIILMGGNHQFIAVPGCMNPYTWIGVDSKGKTDNSLGGTFYNIANIPSMALQSNTSTGENSNTLFSNISSADGTKTGTLETKILANKLKKVADNASKGRYALRKVRAHNDASLGSGILDWIGIGSDFRELAKMAEQGFIESFPNAKNYFGIKDGIWNVDTKYIDVYGIPVEGSEFGSNRTVPIVDSFVYTDNLGAAHFDDSGQSIDTFKTFNVESYSSSSDTLTSLKSSMASWGSSSDNGFTNTYNSIENGDMVIPSNVSKEAMIGLYVTYAYASLYDETTIESKEKTIGALGYKLNTDGLPRIPNESLQLSSSAKSDIMLSSIRDWLYYLLHPTEGLVYFKTWITNKLNSFLVGWHNDMVGTNGTGSINGTTNYRGTSGYVTTPELSDIPWTDSLLDLYKNAIPFLLVAMILVMLGAYVVGVLSFQKAVIGFLIFCITAQLPTIVINGVVGTSNRFSSNLYGEKFTYWALVQHESYADAIDKAATSGDYSNYLKTLYETNSIATGNQGEESIMLKWQAPKKMASLMLTENDKSALSGFSSSKLLSGLINSTYSGENYLDNDDSVYLYRSYIDIANFSRYIHRGLTSSPTKQPINLNLTSDITRNWNDSLKEAISNYESTYEADRALGYANKNGNGSTSGMGSDILRVRLPLSSGIVSEAYGKKDNIKNMGLDDYVGINQDAFEFSIPMFNVGSLDYYDVLKTDNFNPEKYTREDFSGLAAYGLMSENPFYYFSWYLYESGLSADTSTNIGYKNLLLGEDNAGFFYNTQGNGELKDFMDMRSLFTYIIPYLKQGNDIVKEWDETYGIFTYEGVPTEEGHQNDADIKNNPELRQKYWHNLNVARLYNIYTPWVDIMYDCSYAKEEKIEFLGEKYIVSDPLNPASYPDERPMIFSKSEMVDYGLKENQLTKVERLIIKCEEGMQERMFNLLNYYSFSDVVLNTASAMNCAFEFNSTFSENSIVGSNHNIYPQSFELNDFSYDAFLRFILANSTGESMIVSGDNDFYANLVNKSSTTTIIVMLILDIISVYVIPALKIFFIMGMFIMSILMILMTAFKVDPQFKFVKRLSKSFVAPMLKFLAINCAMAFIVSLFMGEGSTAVTGSLKPTISLGDPVMVMLAMIVLNCIVLYLFCKLLYGVWKDIKMSSKLIGNFLTGVAGSVGGLALATAVGNAGRKFNENFGGSRNGYTGDDSPSPRAKKRNSVTFIERNGEREIRKTAYDRRSIKKLEKEYKKANIKKVSSSSSSIDLKSKAGLSKLRRKSKNNK